MEFDDMNEWALTNVGQCFWGFFWVRDPFFFFYVYIDCNNVGFFFYFSMYLGKGAQ